ncbi:MAG: Tgt2/MlaC family protein [Planctomycetota bacterium]|jgi:phospholipid transport system substrate-binding protein
MKSLFCALLVFLVAGQAVGAEDKYPDKLNKTLRTSCDTVVKNPNDPNEVLMTKCDSVVNDSNDTVEQLRIKFDAVVKNPNDPNEVLMTKWDSVISVLQKEDIDLEVKEQVIDKIVSPIFDFPLMAKLTLGRKHWSKLTGQQREKFTQLFVERLKNSYRDKISHYRDEKAILKDAVHKKNTIQIPIVLISDNKEITMLYKLHKMDKSRKVKVDEKPRAKVKERWKIYDMEIQGVSILLTYRSQFEEILRSGTVKDLLSQLEEPPTR